MDSKTPCLVRASSSLLPCALVLLLHSWGRAGADHVGHFPGSLLGHRVPLSLGLGPLTVHHRRRYPDSIKPISLHLTPTLAHPVMGSSSNFTACGATIPPRHVRKWPATLSGFSSHLTLFFIATSRWQLCRNFPVASPALVCIFSNFLSLLSTVSSSNKSCFQGMTLQPVFEEGVHSGPQIFFTKIRSPWSQAPPPIPIASAWGWAPDGL